jgi:hypothetical protein
MPPRSPFPPSGFDSLAVLLTDLKKKKKKKEKKRKKETFSCHHGFESILVPPPLAV